MKLARGGRIVRPGICAAAGNDYPTAELVVQQLRESSPEAGPYRYIILDRDSKFDADVIALLKSTGLKPKRTSVQAPWQDGIAER